MDELKLNYEELRSIGSILNKTADDYYEICLKMRVLLDSIYNSASVHYYSAFEVYKYMLSIYENLSSLSVGTAKIADQYENTELELLSGVEKLSDDPLFDESGSIGAAGSFLIGSASSASWSTSEVKADDFVPSVMISSDMQHDDWLIRNYAEKYMKKE